MKLLPKVRNACLIAWVLLSVFSSGILLLQTLSGRLWGIIHLAWIWEIINIVPGLAVLLYSLMHQVLPLKFMPVFKARILQVSTYFYGMLLLATIFAEPIVIWETELSLQAYLMVSLWWLGPINLLLVLSFVWSFLSKAGKAPDEQLILKVAQEYAEKSRKKGDELRRVCFEAIAMGNLDDVFNVLKEHFTTVKESRQNDIILLQGEYNTLQRTIGLNLVDRNEAQININRITMALLQIIEAM